MKKKFFLLLVLGVFLTAGCNSFKNTFFNSPEVMIKDDFDGDGIAVLTFAKEGNIPVSACKSAADNLADAFFLVNKFNIVDRSKTNDAQVNIKIKSSEFLNSDQIQQLGLSLKAGYLALGRIRQYAQNEYRIDNEKKELNISLRIISVLNSEVVGMADYTTKYTGDINKQIKEMVYEISRSIEKKRVRIADTTHVTYNR